MSLNDLSDPDPVQMNPPENQDLDVDALMRQIRTEIAGRASRAPASGQGTSGTNRPGTGARGAFDGERVTLSRLAETAAAIPRKVEYAVNEFLNYHDEDFVRNAYRGMLGREPDAEGARRFLVMLRTGDFAKVEILGRIRFSPEGRAAAVRVTGLLVPFALRTLRRIPVLGHGLGIIQYILRLPNIVRNHERLEAVVFLHQLEMRRGVNAIDAEIEAALQRSQDLIVGSSDAIEGKITAHESATHASLNRVAERLDSMTTRVAVKIDRPEIAALEQRIQSEGDLRRAQLTTQLETLERRIQSETNAKLTHVEAVTKKINAELPALRSLVDALEKWTSEQPTGALLRETIEVAAAAKAHAGRIAEDFSKRPPGILKAGQSAAVRNERDHLFDGFYVSFEDTFRGTREDIKQRVEVYLPYVREAGAGTAKAPVLDIGCGRGEWLELLNENGLAASGVDLNRVAAAHCRERGLVVAEADGLDYLRGLKTASIGAVTAIHVIEHIPFRELMFLFDEVRRVLKPGGVAIFETPNPENLIVGACNFWYDPTHQQPLPPEPMRFILDNRGFTRVEILRLHPSTDMSPSTEVPNELPALIAERFYGPQDYALIGYKS